MIRLVLALLLLAGALPAQRQLSGTAQIRQALERLTVTGSVLMIAAHPDDENTALLAYFARGRKLRTGYLSLNRGEGGQNLIGPEQGALIGLIRTQELLAARRIDGAEQLFTRAIDFGFSKTATETLDKWGRDQVLADVVYLIRTFRPDVIVNRFSGTERDGHGNHQVSALLGDAAFRASGDPTKFPEQLKTVQPWQARRLFWNVFAFTREQEQAAAKLTNVLRVDTGTYDPVLGYSYTEIAGMSRSQHRSQAMGSPERKGSSPQMLQLLAGDPATQDPFDGIDVSWGRVKGGAAVGAVLERAVKEFDATAPHKSVGTLLEARKLLAAINDPIAVRKREELDEAIALCAGLWLDANADRYQIVPGDVASVTVTILNRSPLQIESPRASLVYTKNGREYPGDEHIATHSSPLITNQPVQYKIRMPTHADLPYTQPYWLRKPAQAGLYALESPEQVGPPENQPFLRARIVVSIQGQELRFERPVQHRYVDATDGEQVRPLVVVPAVALRLSTDVLVFPTADSRPVDVVVSANQKAAHGEVRLSVPDGWRVSPRAVPFTLENEGQQQTTRFVVTPPQAATTGEMRAVAILNGQPVSAGMDVIRYPHFPPQTVFPEPDGKLIRDEIRTLATRVGYVMGAGDTLPQAIRQLGPEVVLLSEEDLAAGDLSRYDAIVTGVRAYNTRMDLRASHQRLMDYVQQGGTLVVQYNTLERSFPGDTQVGTGPLGPYPFKLSRDRVTVEESPVTFPNADLPLLRYPNKITTKDFEHWVQERGLYFPGEWDPRYQPVFTSADPGEKPLAGGTLFARHGKGAYIYTSYAWFRQLPAGVPGAFRIMANFLSAGKAGAEAAR